MVAEEEVTKEELMMWKMNPNSKPVICSGYDSNSDYYASKHEKYEQHPIIFSIG